jgi:hypothetical protein
MVMLHPFEFKEQVNGLIVSQVRLHENVPGVFSPENP